MESPARSRSSPSPPTAPAAGSRRSTSPWPFEQLRVERARVVVVHVEPLVAAGRVLEGRLVDLREARAFLDELRIGDDLEIEGLPLEREDREHRLAALDANLFLVAPDHRVDA